MTIISLLRGINLASHNRIKMDALRAVYESLGLRHPQTYVQSGNVVFRSEARDLARLARRIEDAIERSFGFRPGVILRTAQEMKEVIARNPFAGRKGIEPNRLLVGFLAGDPSAEAREKLLGIKADPEEVRIHGREIYVYYPNGMARPKLSWATIERTLGTSATGRNWNTVQKLLEMV